MNPIQVICPHCKAGVGQPCQVPGTQTRLSLSPAHPSRMELAGKTPAYSVVERYRELHRPADTARDPEDADN